MTVRLVDPRTDSAAEAFTPAARPATLEGARVALLANGKTHGELILETLAAELREQHGIDEVRVWTKPHPSGPPTPDQLDEIIAFADLVVTAIGDCGSCSSCSVFDGIAFERRGIPCAVIITDPFRATATAIAGLNGANGFRVVTLTHPITSKDRDALEAETRGVVDLVTDIWLTGPVAQTDTTTPSRSLDDQLVKSVIEEFREALNSDGSDLALESIAGHQVIVRLGTIGDGCSDCLLPAAAIEAMLRSALSAEVGSAVDIILMDHRATAAAS